jgi:hypothetical protein
MIASQRDSQRRFRVALNRIHDTQEIVKQAKMRCVEAMEAERKMSPRPLIRAVSLSQDAEYHLSGADQLEAIQVTKVRFAIEVAVECLIYAQESIRYEEFDSAIVDLERTEQTLNKLTAFLTEKIEPNPIETVNSWIRPKISRVLWFRRWPSAKVQEGVAASVNSAYLL